jgi:hypothetical protein
MDPCIFDLGTSWRSNGQLHAFAALSPREKPIVMRLRGPRKWLGRCGKEESLALSGLELRPFDRPSCSQSLYRLSYSCSRRVSKFFQNMTNFKCSGKTITRTSWLHSFQSSELEFFLQPTDSRPVRLGIGPPFGTLDQILSCSSFFCWQILDYSF